MIRYKNARPFNTKSKKHEIEVSESLNTEKSGVYKITIGDYYYYGSALTLRRRIMAHLSAFRTGFRSRGGHWHVVRDYTGRVTIELIKLTDDYTEMLQLEASLLDKNDPKCLNKFSSRRI